MNNWEDDFEYVGNQLEERESPYDEPLSIGCSIIVFILLIVFVVFFWQTAFIH